VYVNVGHAYVPIAKMCHAVCVCVTGKHNENKRERKRQRKRKTERKDKRRKERERARVNKKECVRKQTESVHKRVSESV